ncbi:MAG: putative cobaltochelatase [Desulfobaccales bacterium]|jgi:magnesium chelatase subunit D
MTLSRSVYPFAAIVGQERLKKSLILNAINPRLGGVLIRGEKGTAKSTAARGLAELLPPIRVVVDCPFHCDPAEPDHWCEFCRKRREQGVLPTRERPMPVVDLPLGTTEDRLLGTIDLEKAIKTGEKHFEPGILAAAHRGILYVDEVNLLDDHLVDVILDAAAMGVNVVEREGISFTHPARFILVGTMNPEEGELRPQLLDRFGLCVGIGGLKEPSARMEVVERLLDYEEAPELFITQWQPEQERLRQSIIAARERLSSVGFAKDILNLITTICLDQGVDGHRADIYMLKTARTLAAYHERQEVTDDDVREAAELVLPHRLRRQPFSEPQMDQEKLEESIRKHQQQHHHDPPPSDSPPPEESSPLPPPEAPPGRGEVIFEAGSPFPVRPLDLPHDRRPKESQGRRTRAVTQDRSGRYVRPAMTPAGPPDLALDATLRAAAPYQPVRDKGNLAVAITEPDLRHKVREKRIGHHILFVVDASGSMGANQRMVETKGAILSLLLDAYQKRERVGLVVFRGEQAHLTLPFTHSIEQARKCLEDLPTGGKTPLPRALQLAHGVIQREKLKHPQDAFLLVLISDGKPNISLGSATALDDTKEMSVQLRGLGISSLVLDTEAGFLNLSCLPQVAAELKGKYFKIQDIRASEVVARIDEIMVG